MTDGLQKKRGERYEWMRREEMRNLEGRVREFVIVARGGSTRYRKGGTDVPSAIPSLESLLHPPWKRDT